MAAIGEKELFFYVPRDRKYRNGDRPNRVTTSCYWKATGADRIIRGENAQPIGLKKTLVFYSGKAPKGIRTSWIMNEYRLPQGETERLQKAELSICRVYKRSALEGPSCSKDKHGKTPEPLPSSQSTVIGDSSSSSEMTNKMAGSSNTIVEATMPMFQKQNIYYHSTESNDMAMMHHSNSMAPAMIDELNRIPGYRQIYYIHQPRSTSMQGDDCVSHFMGIRIRQPINQCAREEDRLP